MRIQLQQFATVTATPRTAWTFALLADGEGADTAVELTLGDRSARVAATLVELLAAAGGADLAGERDVAERLGLARDRLRRDAVLATATSALRSAVTQLAAARAGVSLHRFLGAGPVASVELYANINRALFATDRAPADFARAAERAARAGFRSFKCAPFDEVARSLRDTEDHENGAWSRAGWPPSSDQVTPAAAPATVLGAAAPGLARVRAVRAAIGAGARLLVDCHCRFTAATAPPIAEELAQLGVGWFEEPVQPHTAAADLAAIARRVRLPVAGGESGYGRDFFDDLLDRGAVSVIMPDIKHCGGVAEAVRTGRSALGRGGAFSLHSPSGPVSLLAGAHVTAAVPGALPLEHAVDEVGWRADLINPAERIEAGRLLLPPGPGLGATLDWRSVQRHGRTWTP